MYKKTYIYIILVLMSCTNNIDEQYNSFKNQSWHTDSVLTFDYTIVDTTKTYDLSLNVRYTTDYEFQNLFLFLKGSHNDTIEIFLKNKNGKPIGKGVSNLREISYTFDKKRKFNKKGKYELQIEQAMRHGSLDKIQELKHITDIGLIVSKND